MAQTEINAESLNQILEIFMLCLLLGVGGAVAADSSYCIEESPHATNYTYLSVVDWSGSVDGFCQGLFNESDLIAPLTSLSCESFSFACCKITKF